MSEVMSEGIKLRSGKVINNIYKDTYYFPLYLRDFDKAWASKIHDEIFDQKEKVRSMKDAIRNMIEYCNREKAEGTAIKGIFKHLKGAFKGRANSKEFKRVLFCNETTDLE